MIRLLVVGNLVRDPETGTTQGGVNYCTFTVAGRKKFHREGEPDAEFVRVTAWRGLGETCAKYLKKGRSVTVMGEPAAHAWNGQNGEARGALEMTADEVEFNSGGSGGRPAPTDADAPPERGADAAAADQAGGFTQVETDDLPF